MCAAVYVLGTHRTILHPTFLKLDGPYDWAATEQCEPAADGANGLPQRGANQLLMAQMGCHSAVRASC